MDNEDFWRDIPEESIEFVDKVKDLSTQEKEEIRELAQAIQGKEDSEAKKEKHKKRRVLYQRAPEDALPFIVYCLYVGVWGGVTLAQLPTYSGQKLWVLSGLVALVMILPLLALPFDSWKKSVWSTWNWIRP